MINKGLIEQALQFAIRNPSQVQQKMDIGQATIQRLMSSGMLTQEQYNGLYQDVQAFKQDPTIQGMLAQMMGRK